MNEFSVILICLPGYLTLTLYRSSKDNYFNLSDGWHLIFRTLMFGSINVLISKMLIVFVSPVLNANFKDVLENLCSSITSNKFLWIIVVSIPVSVIVARILSSKITILLGFIAKEIFFHGLNADWSEIKLNIINWQRLIRFPENNLFGEIYGLVNKYVMVTLRNNKVYVGILNDADLSALTPFEEKTLSIIPIISGYRNDELKVKYTTEYIVEMEILPITMFIKDLDSIREFDTDLHMHFNGKDSKAGQ